MGDYEVAFAYDGGSKWNGLGVQRAVDNVNNIIAPALVGQDATRQLEIDRLMIELDGTPGKTRLGGNAIASVSAALVICDGLVLKGAGPEIYRLQDNKLCCISSMAAFEHLGLAWEDVRVVRCEKLRAIPDGPPSPEDAGKAPQP